MSMETTIPMAIPMSMSMSIPSANDVEHPAPFPNYSHPSRVLSTLARAAIPRPSLMRLPLPLPKYHCWSRRMKSCVRPCRNWSERMISSARMSMLENQSLWNSLRERVSPWWIPAVNRLIRRGGKTIKSMPMPMPMLAVAMSSPNRLIWD